MCRYFVFGSCFVMYLLSSFTIVLINKRELHGCFTLAVFMLSFGCLCFVSLPHGALGWSVTVAFPGYTHLFFLYQLFQDIDLNKK